MFHVKHLKKGVKRFEKGSGKKIEKVCKKIESKILCPYLIFFESKSRSGNCKKGLKNRILPIS
jgi:hypothetical protein